jgi:translation elongation factor EF-Tu-like GTPase
MITGTAGHIDHGKTSLMKALTVVDADRLNIQGQTPNVLRGHSSPTTCNH